MNDAIQNYQAIMGRYPGQNWQQHRLPAISGDDIVMVADAMGTGIEYASATLHQATPELAEQIIREARIYTGQHDSDQGQKTAENGGKLMALSWACIG